MLSQNQGEEVQVKLMTSLNDKSHGSLFLRIGAIAFGLGTLIYTGLEFLASFEVPRTCRFWQVLLGVNPVLYMVFVFMQMYYIFMHARLNVNKNKVKRVKYHFRDRQELQLCFDQIAAKFGMMHLVATNACIVVRTLVKESAREIFLSQHAAAAAEAAAETEEETGSAFISVTSVVHFSSIATPNLTESEVRNCKRVVILGPNFFSDNEEKVFNICPNLGDTIEHSSVYLFPFIVEYSIIGSAVLYRMWKHIGRNPGMDLDASKDGRRTSCKLFLQNTSWSAISASSSSRSSASAASSSSSASRWTGAPPP